MIVTPKHGEDHPTPKSGQRDLKLAGAIFAADCVPPAIRLAERKALDAPFGCSSVVLTTDR